MYTAVLLQIRSSCSASPAMRAATSWDGRSAPRHSWNSRVRLQEEELQLLRNLSSSCDKLATAGARSGGTRRDKGRLREGEGSQGNEWRWGGIDSALEGGETGEWYARGCEASSGVSCSAVREQRGTVTCRSSRSKGRGVRRAVHFIPNQHFSLRDSE